MPKWFCYFTDSSACTNAPCQLCQLTRANPLGFKCTCPHSKVLLFDGACESRFSKTICIHIVAVCFPPMMPCGGFVVTSTPQTRGSCTLPWVTSKWWSSGARWRQPCRSSLLPMMASCRLTSTGNGTDCTGPTRPATSNARVLGGSRQSWFKLQWQVCHFWSLDAFKIFN